MGKTIFWLCVSVSTVRHEILLKLHLHNKNSNGYIHVFEDMLFIGIKLCTFDALGSFILKCCKIEFSLNFAWFRVFWLQHRL